MPNDSIIAPRVALVDPNTGKVSTEWYRFFFALSTLVLNNNTTSIADLQVGPPAITAGEVVNLLDRMSLEQLDAALVSDLAELTKAVQGLGVAPPTLDLSTVEAAIHGLQVAPVAQPPSDGFLLVVTTTATPTTITSGAGTLLVNVGAAAAVTLPVPTAGRRVTVKDKSGAAGVNNITVSPPSGTIDGAATYVLTANYQSADFLADGTNYWVI